MTKLESCLCIGAAHWDIIGRMANDRDDAGRDCPGTVVRRPGGVALNAAVVLKASGIPVTLSAAIGRDDPGETLAGRIAASGIGCEALLRVDGATDSYVGIETFAGSLLGAVADCRLLEAHGTALAHRAIDWIRAHEPTRVVLDGNLPEAAIRAVLAGTLQEVSVLAASSAKVDALSQLPDRHRISLYATRVEAEVLLRVAAFPDAVTAAIALKNAGFASATITDGAGDAASAGLGFVERATPPTVRIVRITGAGDTFAAAHISALAKGEGQLDALRIAIEAAAHHISTDTA